MNPHQRPRPEEKFPSDLRRREYTLRAEIEALEGQVVRPPAPRAQQAPRERDRDRQRESDRFRHPVEVELHDRIEFATRARGAHSENASRKRSQAARHFRRFLWLCAIMAAMAVWLLMKG